MVGANKACLQKSRGTGRYTGRYLPVPSAFCSHALFLDRWALPMCQLFALCICSSQFILLRAIADANKGALKKS